MSAPEPLRENLPFAFVGEKVERARIVTAAERKRLIGARNQTGKSNIDVLRDFIGASREGGERRFTAIDFPSYMDGEEARLYAEPHRVLEHRQVSPHSHTANEELRAAIARLERYLACPVTAAEASFAWIEEAALADETLIVWARDDDFSAAVLASRAFSLWHAQLGSLFAALRAFPFPWPPGTTLNALSKSQEELRFALGRAARNHDADSLEVALAAAYGWSTDLDDEDILANLHRLHAQRQAM